MRYIVSFVFVLLFSSMSFGAGSIVSYKVGEANFEGYFVSPFPGAPLILFVHTGMD